MNIAETARLRLRRLNTDDAPFIFTLVNDPNWLRFIGDKGVRNLDDARSYIVNGPQAMYAKYGFGLYLVERLSDGIALGMCGLLKRDTLEDADIGFAFLPQYVGQGYAFEAAAATMALARSAHHLRRVVAIASPDNEASARLLGKLGFVLEKRMQLVPGDEVSLFGIALD